tara:strand:- start:216 stop:419 length:204 start_codon:yes stop_codon:yes gene_type:complete
MAAIAGIGDPEFAGEERVGREEAVVAPRVALHVGGLRHMALDTLVSRTAFSVAAMDYRIDNGSLSES